MPHISSQIISVTYGKVELVLVLLYSFHQYLRLYREEKIMAKILYSGDSKFMNVGAFVSVAQNSFTATPSINELVTEFDGTPCDQSITQGETLIVVPTTMRDALTKEELHAILMHEMGHICLGHLGSFKELMSTAKKDSMTIINVLQYELDADAFAIRIVGKDVLVRALGKVAEYLKTVFFTRMGEEAVVAVASGEGFKQLANRIAVLSK